MRQKEAAKDPMKFRQDSIRDAKNAVAMTKINGRPVSDKPFLSLINADASRWNGIVEGLFGESIQLHRDYLLGDIFLGRPIIVKYSSWVNYAIELLVVALFLAGLFYGRKDRIIQMLLAWFAIDLIIHVVLGFGLNEVAINGGHWMFIIPIALAWPAEEATRQRSNIYQVSDQAPHRLPLGIQWIPRSVVYVIGVAFIKSS